MVKYLFFDFDGTISDARKLTYESIIHVLDSFYFHYSKSKVKILMGYKIQEILMRLGIKRVSASKIRRKFYSAIINKKKLSKLKLCCDVKPLWDLKKKGYQLIIVSNSESSFLKASIKQLKLEGLFYDVFGSESFKTKDEMLKKLLKKYNIKGKETFYIGDRFSDINYAHFVKMNSIAIYNKCSWSSKKILLKEKPDYLISNWDDLKFILEKS